LDIPEALNQKATWADRDGNVYKIAEMDPVYARNVHTFLLRRADQMANAYGLYLTASRMPEGEMAFDAVSDAIDREFDAMSKNAEAWLAEKPLLRALKERAISGVFVAPEFKPAPRRQAGGTVQQDGDDARVFVVMSWESGTVYHAFVGNREAADVYRTEVNRYDRAAVQAVTSNATSPRNIVRRYRDPWTEVKLTARVAMTTGEVVYSEVTGTRVRNDMSPVFHTDKTHIKTLRWGSTVEIVSTGPDTSVPALRQRHADAVNEVIRAAKEA